MISHFRQLKYFNMINVHEKLEFLFNFYIYIRYLLENFAPCILVLNLMSGSFYPLMLPFSIEKRLAVFSPWIMLITFIYFIAFLINNAIMKVYHYMEAIQLTYQWLGIEPTTKNLLKMYIFSNLVCLFYFIGVENGISTDTINYFNSEEYSGSLLNDFQKQLKENTSLLDATDIMQSKYQCCGIVDPIMEYENKSYPDSCCPQKNHCTIDNSYKESCSDNIKSTVFLMITLQVVVIRGLILLMMAGTIIPLLLVLAKKNYSQDSFAQFEKTISQFTAKLKFFNLTRIKLELFLDNFCIQIISIPVFLISFILCEILWTNVLRCEYTDNFQNQIVIIFTVFIFTLFLNIFLLDIKNLIDSNYVTLNILVFFAHLVSLVFFMYMTVMSINNFFYIQTDEFTDYVGRSFGYPVKTWESSQVNVDDIQSKLKCCGFMNATIEYNNMTLPSSCCPDKINCTFENIYKDGCKNYIISNISLPIIYTGGISFMFFLVELTFFSMVIFSVLKDPK